MCRLKPTTSAMTIAASLRVIGLVSPDVTTSASQLLLWNTRLAQAGDKVGLDLLQKDRIV
jgi:hypothetical protein